LRLVDIGCGAVDGAGAVMARPRFSAPAMDAHKYRRGLLGVVAGAMPGAAVLAATAAQGAGAGYVKVLSDAPLAVPADLVAARADFGDDRMAALLIGPGLGRDAGGHFLLAAALAAGKPTVLDADGCYFQRFAGFYCHTA
jgi:NAD(P)H-hydrate repair Nnr-like enzyme with NAD(P)H-hydrate dehydratase domain